MNLRRESRTCSYISRELVDLSHDLMLHQRVTDTAYALSWGKTHCGLRVSNIIYLISNLSVSLIRGNGNRIKGLAWQWLKV